MTGRVGKNARTTRRRVLQGIAGSTAALATGARLPAAYAQAAPIKVACLNVFTGTFTTFGETTFNGLNLYFDRIGWKSAGRKIELLREDDQMSPQIGLEKVRKLVESDKVDIICGPLGSNVALAMINYMKAAKCIWIVTGAGATGLSWAHLPYMFRTTFSFWQASHAMGAWAAANSIKTAVASGSDYVAGRESVGYFKEAFEAGGGRILKEIYPPLGTTDFSPYLADIRSLAPEGAYGFYGGNDSVRFVKQFDEFGLKTKSQILGYSSVLDTDTFEGQGRSALGGLSIADYCDTLNNPENAAFAPAYRERYKDYPSTFSENGYATAQIIDTALQAVGGDVSNKDKFAAAIAGIRIKAPRGPISFDPPTHQAIHNLYIRKVVELDGRIANVAIATIPEVGELDKKS